MNIILASSVAVIVLVVTTSYHLLHTLEQVEDELYNVKKKVTKLEKIDRNETNDGK